MDGVLDQFRTEWLHVASVALVYGGLGIVAVLWWYYQRYVKRTDAAAAEIQTKRDLAHTVLEQKLEEHIRRTGWEIKDTQYKVGILAAQVQRAIPEVEIPEWPTR